MNQTPYENLDPNLIFDAIESQDYLCTGTLLALNSYENRVYQVGIENQPTLVAKFYRPDRWTDAAIQEEHDFALELAEHDLPIVAPLSNPAGQTLHHYQGFRFALFPCMGGRIIDLDQLEHLEWMGRFLGRMHTIGKRYPFEHRQELNAQRYGYDAFNYLKEHQFIPDYLRANYENRAQMMLEVIDEKFAAAGNYHRIRLHGDMHPGNILWRDQGPHIVDLDDCLMGPAIQDIWMLITGEAEQKQLQMDCILEAYQQFCDFDYRELHLIEALRSLRMLHHSAWIAKRWHDPAFPRSFTWFDTPQYWQEQIRYFEEQIEAMQGTRF